MEKRIRLVFGYERGGEPESIRDVVVSRRMTGADVFRIGDELEGQSQTQFQLMALQASITKFGDLVMPVPLNVLLSLKRADRRLISGAYDEMVKEMGGKAKSEKLAERRYKLGRGFSHGGEFYDVVEFGNHLTGYDELEADEMIGHRQVCFLIGKEIARLSQSNGPAQLSGPVAVEMFEELFAEELFDLERFESDWLNSFRPAEGVQIQTGDGDGNHVSDDAPQGDGRGQGSQA